MFIYFIEFTHEANTYVKVGITKDIQSRAVNLIGRFLDTYNISTNISYAEAENSQDIEHLALGLCGPYREPKLFKKVSTEILNIPLTDILKTLEKVGICLNLKEFLPSTSIGVQKFAVSHNASLKVAKPSFVSGLRILDEITVLVSDIKEPLVLNSSSLAETCRYYGWSRPQVQRVLNAQGLTTNTYYVPENPPEVIMSEKYLEGWKELPTKVIKVVDHSTGEVFYSCVNALIKSHLGTNSSLSGMSIRNCEFPKLGLTTTCSVVLYYKIRT